MAESKFALFWDRHGAVSAPMCVWISCLIDRETRRAGCRTALGGDGNLACRRARWDGCADLCVRVHGETGRRSVERYFRGLSQAGARDGDWRSYWPARRTKRDDSWLDFEHLRRSQRSRTCGYRHRSRKCSCRNGGSKKRAT
jgi:hypothetical protein